MSTWDDHDVRCPFCAASMTVTVATSVHVTRVPEVRERALRGELHRFTCQTCTESFEVRLALLYTDLERGHWVEVHPTEHITRWPELAAACTRRFDHVYRHGSPLMRAAREPRVRIVFGYEELRDKLVAWDAGFDDAALETTKLLAIRRDVSILGFGDRLLASQLEGDRIVIDRHRGGAVFDSFTIPLAALADSALEFPDPFVSIDRFVGPHAS